MIDYTIKNKLSSHQFGGKYLHYTCTFSTQLGDYKMNNQILKQIKYVNVCATKYDIHLQINTLEFLTSVVLEKFTLKTFKWLKL